MKKLIYFRDQFILQMVERSKPIYAKFFKRNKTAWKHDLRSLSRFPKRSLGNDLYQFLKKEKLDLMPKFEDHDVMHVLFNYRTTIQDEIKMQFFLLGNGKKSIYALFSAMLGLVIVPEHIKSYFREFHLGKRSRNFSGWNFECLLNEPSNLLRKLIFRENCAKEAPFFI